MLCHIYVLVRLVYTEVQMAVEHSSILLCEGRMTIHVSTLHTYVTQEDLKTKFKHVAKQRNITLSAMCYYRKTCTRVSLLGIQPKHTYSTFVHAPLIQKVNYQTTGQ